MDTINQMMFQTNSNTEDSREMNSPLTMNQNRPPSIRIKTNKKINTAIAISHLTEGIEKIMKDGKN
jgi:hypothetical protein